RSTRARPAPFSSRSPRQRPPTDRTPRRRTERRIMQILRRTANALLWILAVAGAASGLVWGVTAVGLIQPLVVISGSMEPEIVTGDLIIDVKTDAAGLEPGDVVSLPSPITHDLVTHRIVSVDGVDGIAMADDAASDASFRIT